MYKKEAPKKILYKYCEYEFNSEINDYQNSDSLELFTYLFTNEEHALFLEVEILEDEFLFGIDNHGYIHTKNGSWKGRKLDIEFVKAFNYLLRNCVLFGEEESQKLNGHIKENSITEKGNIFEECEK